LKYFQKKNSIKCSVKTHFVCKGKKQSWLNPGNVCYNWISVFWPSSCSIKIKIWNFARLPSVLYWRDLWSHTLREQYARTLGLFKDTDFWLEYLDPMKNTWEEEWKRLLKKMFIDKYRVRQDNFLFYMAFHIHKRKLPCRILYIFPI
jgi:hypothetical protein